jgi:hypothetical protein
VDPGDLVAGDGEHAERVAASQVLLGGKRHPGEMVELGDVAGAQAGVVEGGPVVRAVGVGVPDRGAKPLGLQGAELVDRSGLDRVERDRLGLIGGHR